MRWVLQDVDGSKHLAREAQAWLLCQYVVHFLTLWAVCERLAVGPDQRLREPEFKVRLSLLRAPPP